MVMLLLACHSLPSETAQTPSPDDSVDTASGDSPSPDSGDSDSGEPTLDADGDGYALPEDCHDQNPFIHPGAEEYCDAVDQDCDGEPLAPGVCAKPVAVEAMYTPVFGLELLIYPFAVQDPGGGPDGALLGVCNGTCVDDQITSGVYRDVGLVEDLPLFPGGADFTFDHFGSASNITLPTDPGDVTGDGIADLAVLDETGVVGYAVFPGPIADGAHLTYTNAYMWRVPELPTPGMASARTGGDVDGDGVNDLAMYSLDSIHHRSEFAILFGHDGPDADVVLLDYNRDVVIGGMSIAQDFDGDGINDLFMDGYVLGWISGADLRALDGAFVDGVMTTTFVRTGEDSGGYRSGRPSVSPVGDVDGDGYPEVALADDASDAAQELYGANVGELYLVSSGGEVGLHRLDDHATSVLGPPDEEAGAVRHIAHVIGDTGSGQAVAWVDEYGGGWLIPTSLPGLHTEFGVVRSVRLLPDSESGKTWFFDFGPDLNGDDVGDFTAVSSEFYSAGFVPGFIPPWDDPTYW